MMFWKKKSELVTLQCHPHGITCVVTQLEFHNIQPFTIKFYYKYTCKNLELEHQKIFNPTRLLKTLKPILAPFSQLPVVISLQGPSVIEQCLRMTTTHATLDDFGSLPKKHWIWDFFYLYTNDFGDSLYYIAGIPHWLLFQYKLLFRTVFQTLAGITTSSVTHFYLYKLSRGPSYRTAQLGAQLQNCNNLIDQLVNKEFSHRFVKNYSFCIENNMNSSEILGALGLHAYYEELL